MLDNILKRSVCALAIAAAAGVLVACASPEEKIARLTKSGEAYLAEKEFGKANVQFQNALKIDEEHIPAISGLASVAEARRDYRALYAALQRVVRLAPDDVSALTKLGKLYLLGSDEQEALKTAERALAIAPTEPEALALKAAVLMKLEDVASAVEHARLALKADPANPEAISVLVGERALEKDFRGALSLLDEAIAIDAGEPVLHILRLQTLKKLGRDDDVREGHRRLIAAFPDEIAYRQIFASALIAEGRLREARDQLAAVAERSPDPVEAVSAVVEIDRTLAGDAAAAATFSRYVDARPADRTLAYAYAGFLRARGDFPAANAVYDGLLSSAKDEPETLRVRNEIAGLRFLEGRREEAIRIVDDILAADERNTDALIKRASVQIDDGRTDEAIRILRTAIADDPKATRARVLMATALERAGEIELADAELALAVDESADDPARILDHAKFLVRNDKDARAETVALDAIAKGKANAEILNLLAALRLKRQDWRGAEEVAALVAERSGDGALAERIRGAASIGLGDFAGAIDFLEAARAREPLAAQPLAVLVGAYVRSGRADEAEALLRQVVQSNKDPYAARILLSELLTVRQDYTEAKALLAAAIDDRPEGEQAYVSLYALHQRDGDLKAARALIEKGLAAAPESDVFAKMRADFLLDAGDNEAALVAYEELRKRRPDDQLVVNNYVSLVTMLRDDAASLQAAAEAAKILENVDNPYFKDTLGWALFRAGESNRAIAILREAVAAAPDLAEAHYHLGVALIETGEAQMGESHLRDAIRLAGEGAPFRKEAQARLTN